MADSMVTVGSPGTWLAIMLGSTGGLRTFLADSGLSPSKRASAVCQKTAGDEGGWDVETRKPRHMSKGPCSTLDPKQAKRSTNLELSTATPSSTVTVVW